MRHSVFGLQSVHPSVPERLVCKSRRRTTYLFANLLSKQSVSPEFSGNQSGNLPTEIIIKLQILVVYVLRTVSALYASCLATVITYDQRN